MKPGRRQRRVSTVRVRTAGAGSRPSGSPCGSPSSTLPATSRRGMAPFSTRTRAAPARRILRRRLSPRQRHREHRPAGLRGAHVDPAAVRHRDRPRDEEPQAEAAAVLGRSPRRKGSKRWGRSSAGIGGPEFATSSRTSPAPRAQPSRTGAEPGLCTVLDRVRDEVREELRHAPGVPLVGAVSRPGGEDLATRVRERALLGDRAGDLREVAAAGTDGNADARADVREVEQRADDLLAMSAPPPCTGYQLSSHTRRPGPAGVSPTISMSRSGSPVAIT